MISQMCCQWHHSVLSESCLTSRCPPQCFFIHSHPQHNRLQGLQPLLYGPSQPVSSELPDLPLLHILTLFCCSLSFYGCIKMAVHSSILAWEILWTEEPGGLSHGQSIGLQKSDTTEQLNNNYTVEGNGTPLQYSCLESLMDGGAWWAAVHGVTKSRTQLSDFTFPFHFHALEKEMATHSSVLAWRIPGTGEPGGLPSMGSHRVGHNWSDLAAAVAAAWLVW